MRWNEDVALELEALQATYGDELRIDVSNSTVTMLLVPLADASASYVQCQLELSIPEQYPEAAPPRIAVQEAKGLDSSRCAALEKQLHYEAIQAMGEMMLGQLFECAKDWLHEHNWPEGPCIFCLEELSTDSSNNNNSSSSISQQHPAQPYMRLPCFHAFHQSCFTDWWCWQQQALMQQQQQLEQRTGATAAAALMQEQLPAKEGEYFMLTCPSCRVAFSFQQDLQHMLGQLQQQLQKLQRQQQERLKPSALQPGCSSSSNSSSQHKLTSSELAPWRDIQQRHAALFAAQQKRNGIITDANYSIAAWDAAAATGAAAEQAVIAQQQCSSTTSATNSSTTQGPSSVGGNPGQPQLRVQQPPAYLESTRGDSLRHGGSSSKVFSRRGVGPSPSNRGSSHSRGRECGSMGRGKAACAGQQYAESCDESRRHNTGLGSSSSRRGAVSSGGLALNQIEGKGPAAQQRACEDEGSSGRGRHSKGSSGRSSHRGRGRGRGLQDSQQRTTVTAGQ